MNNIPTLHDLIRAQMRETAMLEADAAVTGTNQTVVGKPTGMAPKAPSSIAPAAAIDDSAIIGQIKDLANQYLNAIGVIAEQRESDTVGARQLVNEIPAKVTDLVRNFIQTNKLDANTAKTYAESWKAKAAAGGGFIRGLQNLFGSGKSSEATSVISKAIDAALTPVQANQATSPTSTAQKSGSIGSSNVSKNVSTWIGNIKAIDNSWGANPAGTARKWLELEKVAVAKYAGEFAGKKYGTHDMLAYMKGQIAQMTKVLSGQSTIRKRDQLGSAAGARNVATNGLQQDDADIKRRDNQMAMLINQSNITKTLLNSKALAKSLIKDGNKDHYVTVYFNYNGAVDYEKMWDLAKQSITSMLLGETDASVARGIIASENDAIFPTNPGMSHGVVDGASDNQGTGYARILVNAWPLRKVIRA